MHNIMMIVVALLFIIQTRVPVAYEYTKEDEVVKSMKYSSKGPHKILVDIFNGSIAVTGYDSDDVQIKIHRTLYAKSKRSLEEAVQKAQIELNEREQGKIAVYLHVPWRTKDGGMEDQNLLRYDYDVSCNVEIKLPRHTDVVLKMVDRGDISIHNVDGNFEIRHVNGSIFMNEITGSGKAETVIGDVDVRFKENPTHTSSFQTVNGDIKAHFPKSLSANLVMKTVSGEVLTDFEGVNLPNKPTVEEHKQKKIYRIDDARVLKVGNNGPELIFNTMNGSVSVLKNN